MNSIHRSLRSVLVVSLSALVVIGCASLGRERLMLETLDGYRQAVRWGNFEDALAYVDPEFIKVRPYTALDMERYAQVSISAYREGDPVVGPDGKLRQNIGISLFNRHTQVERNLIDRQVWRYDEEAERWWLETGLPEITTIR